MLGMRSGCARWVSATILKQMRWRASGPNKFRKPPIPNPDGATREMVYDPSSEVCPTLIGYDNCFQLGFNALPNRIAYRLMHVMSHRHHFAGGCMILAVGK